MRNFILGLLIGLISTLIFDLVTLKNKKLKEKIWINSRSFRGYKFHHSCWGLIFILLGFINLIFLGLGIGIVIIHTITDGRLVFIEKEDKYRNYAKKFI